MELIRKIICYYIKLYSLQLVGLFEFCKVTGSIYMECYPTTICKDFLLWLFAVTSNEPNMLSLKMGLPGLGVYYVRFYPPPTRSAFRILQVSARRCIACYPITIGKDFVLWVAAQSPPTKRKWSHLKWVPNFRSRFQSGKVLFGKRLLSPRVWLNK